MDKPSETLYQGHNKEEIANALTHALGLLLSIVGLFWLQSTADATGDVWKILSATMFGSSLILLYAASTLYHTFQKDKLKKIMQIVDHCAIYLLIAGSYTPFALVTLNQSWGWTLFAIIWSLALIGVIYKIFYVDRWPILSTLFYLAMGWLVIFDIQSLVGVLPIHGLYLLVGGGLFYSFGAVIYMLEKPVFHHAIWHMFVIGGSTCHYFAILHYVL